MLNKIPVTVLTGFLGSGKTTLLNRILSEDHGLRIAVIENEFGEIGIDQDLVINANEEVLAMNNGCICCNVRGDLIRILSELAEREDHFDRVIIETTGMADPGPVAQTFFVDKTIKERYMLDGIITLVDAKHVHRHLDEGTNEVLAQIAFADRIILNKADLVEADELTSLRKRLKALNPMAGFCSATMGDAPIVELLDIGGFDLQRAVERKSTFLEPEYPYYFDAGHAHHTRVSAVSVALPGLVDIAKISAWLDAFLMIKGEDLYRMKGVLAVKGMAERVLFQGVHMMFDNQPGKPWGDEVPITRMVFIGIDLDEGFIRRSLADCLV